MAGEALGYISCDGCGGDAAIKKLGNSELLYLHCKQCGCDRRSGAMVQEKWQAAINGSQLPESLEATQDPDWKPTPETHKNTPAPVLENPENNTEQNPENSGGKTIGFAVSLLAIAGLIFKAARG
ncbi:hypothetical protein [Shewanella algae]|uniref:hypothetical protein n=1 Tax=Shewanella algae TaxID=38313 RepID=UPI0031F56DD3